MKKCWVLVHWEDEADPQVCEVVTTEDAAVEWGEKDYWHYSIESELREEKDGS